MQKYIQKFIFVVSFLFSTQLFAQVVTTSPAFPTADDEITITFDATKGNAGLMGYTGDVYAHTGVITNLSTGGGDWKYVKAGWTTNTEAAKLTRIATDKYELKITPEVWTYYAVPKTEKVLKLAFVFRSSDGSKTGKDNGGADIFCTIYENKGLSVILNSPSEQSQSLLAELNSTIDIEASASTNCTLTLLIDETQVAQTTGTNISYTHTVTGSGKQWIIAKAVEGTSIVYDSIYYYVKPQVVVANLPAGVRDGINYIDNNTVTLVLYAPFKENVFVVGDFNNWELSEEFQMKKTSDGKRFWLTISNLAAGKEYIYQYLIDGKIKIADPYTNKISEPWNDKYISATIYPNLIPYPNEKTSGIASVLQTAQSIYSWEVPNFELIKKEDLVIYELHIRDFSATSDIDAVLNKLDYLEELGITALELMPINEFEGNDSWGYNPSFYFAPDKAYGTPQKYKELIDECHKRGMAVIIDMVLNHSYGQSPFVQMYFDDSAGSYGEPTAQNPWYNRTSPNPVYSWGFDFNHESADTKLLVDSVVHFWMSEYNVDGFRFDFTKGFTNTEGDGWAYDAARIAILKRMADKIWSIKPNAYVILEHLADNNEEKVLAEYGMMLWGNMNHSYSQNAMGVITDNNLDWGMYNKRFWTKPNLVTYMESHDEERLMYRALTYGSSNVSYNVKDLNTALQRMKLSAGFFITLPGPKMIWQFGELGYDISIDFNGRVGKKPIKWEYFDVPERNDLYKFYSYLIELKKTYDAFEAPITESQLNGSLKYIKLSHASGNFVIVGNFGIESQSPTIAFQHTGTWYDCITGQTVNVNDVNKLLFLNAGDIKIYSDIKISSFIPTSINTVAETGSMTLYPNPTNGNINLLINNNIDTKAHIQIFDISGKCVYQIEKDVDRGTVALNVTNILKDGMYVIQATTQSQFFTQKLIIE